MRCADGAVRPAYNIQIAVAFNGIMTGIQATDRRQDTGRLSPMVAPVEQRTGQAVAIVVADTGYTDHNDIAALATRTDKLTAYVPPPEERTDVKSATLKERERKRAKECGAIKDWRKLMVTDEAKMIMRQRGGIERVNAQVKCRGLARVTARGLAKVHTIALWHALAHNLTAGIRLARAAATNVTEAVAKPVAIHACEAEMTDSTTATPPCRAAGYPAGMGKIHKLEGRDPSQRAARCRPVVGAGRHAPRAMHDAGMTTVYGAAEKIDSLIVRSVLSRPKHGVMVTSARLQL
jgi:hypothetical protein